MSWTDKIQSMRSSLYAVAILALAIAVMWGGAQFNTTTVEASGGNESDAPSSHLMFAGANTGAILDNNPAGRNVTFNVTGVSGTVSDIWISMDLTHSYVGDIDTKLIAPNGTQHVLFASTSAITPTGFGDSSDLLGVYRFIDNATGTNWWAAAAATGATAPIPTGDYRSTQAGPQAAANFSPPTVITSTFAGIPTANGTWTLNVSDNAAGDTGSINAATLAIAAGGGTPPPTTRRGRYDFLGAPGLADFGVFTFPTAGGQLRWRIAQNDNPTTATSNVLDVPWGATASDAIPNVGNYLGDDRPDLTVYRLNTGSPAPNSYLTQATGAGGGQRFQQWGDSTTDFVGAEGDYNGDGVLDYTVVRAANVNDPFTWYILNSGTNTLTSFVYGSSTTDIPLGGADYVGDTKDDPTVIRIGGGEDITFLVGTTGGILLKARQWGTFSTDFVVPGGDYDGDGKADFAVWRAFGSGTNGFWYILRANDTTQFLQWGQGGIAAVRDIALRGGDYDGDGKDDIGIYRPSTMQFIIRRSVDMGTINQGWGIAGNTNRPIASFGIQ